MIFRVVAVAPRFQFQSGAVKRIIHDNRSYIKELFQFQSGAVKSALTATLSVIDVEFQFQSGAVKRRVVLFFKFS